MDYHALDEKFTGLVDFLRKAVEALVFHGIVLAVSIGMGVFVSLLQHRLPFPLAMAAWLPVVVLCLAMEELNWMARSWRAFACLLAVIICLGVGTPAFRPVRKHPTINQADSDSRCIV
ncbi:hypothetical protein [Bifidobacterium myosotis]|uniref:Uncharacterized protein n=1 Tax=Bifidobacterium myosotis TaxID=1630166 RepID=A0A5M9ZHM6_9BIFI|nr:hypothetical protein [Bifidobacterium myosotis]KAA8826945.1 hypothetical protein EMO91_10465 [Bifidobacterium myosotis]